MSVDVPTSEPSTLTAGDTWKWTKSVQDYPASDGWQLSYAFRGGMKLDLAWATEVTAHANGRDFTITVPATKTDKLPKGTYHWAAYATKAAERFEVDHGTLTVRPNLAVGTLEDGKTHAEKTLAVLEAKLEGRLASDLENYVIAGRSVSKIPVSELVKLRQQYRAEVWRERNPGRLGPTVEARFTAPL